MLSSSLDETGGIVTSKFDAHVAEEQKNRALVLKQERLWGEESQSLERRYGGKGAEDPWQKGADPWANRDSPGDGRGKGGRGKGKGDRGRGRGRGAAADA